MANVKDISVQYYIKAFLRNYFVSAFVRSNPVGTYC